MLLVLVCILVCILFYASATIALLHCLFFIHSFFELHLFGLKHLMWMYINAEICRRNLVSRWFCVSLSHTFSFTFTVCIIHLFEVFFSLWIQSTFFSLVCVCMCVDECVWVDVNVYACVIDALLRSVLLFNRFGFGFYGPYVAFFCWQTSCANNMIELLYRLWLHVVPKLPK